MTFRQKILILSGIAGFLVLTLVLGMIFSPSNLEGLGSGQLVYETVKKESVAKIQFAKAGVETQITKNQNIWEVLIDGKGFSCVPAKVDSLVDSILGLKKIRKAANDKAEYASLGLDDTSALSFTLSDQAGKVLAKGKAGKADSQGKGTFVRFDGDDAVYLAEGGLTFYLEQKPEYYANMKFFNDKFDLTTAKSFSLRADLELPANPEQTKKTRIQASYILMKKTSDTGSEWKVQGNESFSLDQNQVSALLSSIINLEGYAFETKLDQAAAGLVPGKAIAEVTADDGTKFVLKVGNEKDKGNFYVQSSGNSNIMLLSSWGLNRFVKPLESLKAQPTPKPAPEKAKK